MSYGTPVLYKDTQNSPSVTQTVHFLQADFWEVEAHLRVADLNEAADAADATRVLTEE